MALALGWGLLFATPLTLVLVPCDFMIGHDVAGELSGEELGQIIIASVVTDNND